MIRIEQDDEDALVGWLARIVNGVAATSRPDAVHVVELDHWFDQKWLGFSGKALGAVGRWATELTVPPFHPHRVLNERHYKQGDDRVGYVAVAGGPTLHREQSSSQNLQRRMNRVAPATACFWYGGDAATAGRAALMAYVPAEAESSGWYVGLAREAEGWRPVTLVGITSGELAHIEGAASERSAG